MLIGAMNHPERDPVQEIEWMAEMGLEFVDLTLEPPAAGAWQINAKAIRETLTRHNLPVVGHTAYYLPIGSPFESIRRAAVNELKKCLEIFAFVGAKWINLHPDRQSSMHQRSAIIELNLQTIHELLPLARRCGVGLMIENLPVHFNSAAQLAQLLDPLPELGLHLDIGHANLRFIEQENTSEEIIAAHGSRLRHVHLHDNKGGSADLHLPLGTGNLDLAKHIRSLKASGYDGTITLEVFSSDRHYLAYSREVLRRFWDECDVNRQAQRAFAP